MAPMDCAYCHKKMRTFAAAGNPESVKRALGNGGVAPLICDKCGEINILLDGKYPQQATEAEMVALMNAPVGPMLRDLQEAYRKNIYKGEPQ